VAAPVERRRRNQRVMNAITVERRGALVVTVASAVSSYLLTSVAIIKVVPRGSADGSPPKAYCTVVLMGGYGFEVNGTVRLLQLRSYFLSKLQQR
jgi:hypothetical protein